MELRNALLVGIAALLASCSSHEEGSSSAEIVGGTLDDGPGPTVLLFRCSGACAFSPFLNAEQICSGTLIAPNLVLTARHCVAQEIAIDSGVLCSKSTFGDVSPAEDFIVTPAKDAFQGGPWTIAREVAVPGNPGDFECGNDLAVLQLRQSYLGAPPAAPRLATAPTKGELYSAVGYGDDHDGGIGYRHRRDGLDIQCVGTQCKLLGSDLVPLVAPSEFLGQTGLCGGDSGGPAIDGNGLIIGVTSRGAPDCTLPVYTRVDLHGAWLQAQAVAAAIAGNYPIPAWAFAALPSDAGSPSIEAGTTFDGGMRDAGAPATDASVMPTPEPVGGCAVGGESTDALGSSLLVIGLLRFVRKGSKSSS